MDDPKSIFPPVEAKAFANWGRDNGYSALTAPELQAWAAKLSAAVNKAL